MANDTVAPPVNARPTQSAGRAQTPRKASVLRLVPKVGIYVCADTVAAFELILAAARAGRVIGAGFVLLHPENGFCVDVCGDGLNRPVALLGMTSLLHEKVCELVHSQELPG